MLEHRALHPRAGIVALLALACAFLAFVTLSPAAGSAATAPTATAADATAVAAVRRCGNARAVLSVVRIRAQGVSCNKAKQVARGWMRCLSRGRDRCRTNGYACRPISRQMNRQTIRCTQGSRWVRFDSMS